MDRTSSALGAGGRAVSSPQPGDVVCYPGHVGIYIGGGQMIHAPQPGDVVKISSVYSCGTPCTEDTGKRKLQYSTIHPYRSEL